MIAKHILKKTGVKSSFNNLVKYVTDDQGLDNRVAQVWTENCPLSKDYDLDTAVMEIELTQARNKTAKEKTYHLLLSFGEGEKPTLEQMKAIEKEVCEALGYGEHQRICVLHTDTDHPHIHICINKIHPKTFKAHTPYNDFKILTQKAKEISKRYFGNEFKAHVDLNNAKANDFEAKTGEKSLITLLRTHSENIRKQNSWQSLHKYLNANGITLEKRGAGLVFGSAGVYVKASSVARDFSLKNLEAKLGKFEPSNYKANSEKAYTSTCKDKTKEDLYNSYRVYRKNIHQNINKQIHIQVGEVFSLQSIVNSLIDLADDMDPDTKRLLKILNSCLSNAHVRCIKQEGKEKKKRTIYFNGYCRELKRCITKNRILDDLSIFSNIDDIKQYESALDSYFAVKDKFKDFREKAYKTQAKAQEQKAEVHSELKQEVNKEEKKRARRRYS